MIIRGIQISGERNSWKFSDCQVPANVSITTSQTLKFDVIDDLIIMYTNADCYLNKMSELKLLLTTLTVKPHVIAITEVKYKTNKRPFCVSELSLDGYDLYGNDFEKNSRGVLIYVSSLV